MSAIHEMVQEAETMQSRTAEGVDVVRPYTTRSWAEVSQMELDPPVIVWGGFAMGVAGAIFGQGGLGKSRMALNIVRNQVLGLPFAGMQTASGPLRHLMMGTENSIHRLINDTRRMNTGLTPEQIELLGAHVQLATLENPDDASITLTDPDNLDRWRKTLEGWRPDMLWVDPWGDVLIGEANSDEDVRATIGKLRRMLHKVNPEAGLVILAHARTGIRNIAQAFGYDAANFGKGSKALYNSVRCVWNLAPGGESDSPPIVCVHAKSNDHPMQKPFALRLDPNTMLYTPVAGFDLDAWQADVGLRASGRNASKRQAHLTEDAAFNALGDAVGTKHDVAEILKKAGTTRDEAKNHIDKLLDSGRWAEWRAPKKNAPTYIGPPAAIERKKQAALEHRKENSTV